jgi:hypothetical protein
LKYRIIECTSFEEAAEKAAFQQLSIPYNRLSAISFQAIEKVINARVTCFGHYL